MARKSKKKNTGTGEPVSSRKERDEREEDGNFFKVFVNEQSNMIRAVWGKQNPEEIIQEVMRRVCELYQGDWCGYLAIDDGVKVCEPVFWYHTVHGWMSWTRFNPSELFESYPSWAEAYESGTPICIPDCTASDTNPIESSGYTRLRASSAMGVPCGLFRPGILVLRNLHRYKMNPEFLAFAALLIADACNHDAEMKEEESRKKSLEKIGAADEAGTVYIRLFGTPGIINGVGSLEEESEDRLKGNQEEKEKFDSKTGWKVLAYLLLRGAPASTSEIYAAVWGTRSVDPARRDGLIRSYIYKLRKACRLPNQDTDFIVLKAGKYSINREARVACDAFRMKDLFGQARKTQDPAVRMKNLREIQNIYTGPMCEGGLDEVELLGLEVPYTEIFREASRMLFARLAEEQDFSSVLSYSVRALQWFGEEPEFYCWHIRALLHQGYRKETGKWMTIAERHLTDEDYRDLRSELRKEFPEYGF